MRVIAWSNPDSSKRGNIPTTLGVITSVDIQGVGWLLEVRSIGFLAYNRNSVGFRLKLQVCLLADILTDCPPAT